MNVYADTSVLIALFLPEDTFSQQVNDWIGDNEVELVWNLGLRNEVRHNLRKLDSSHSRTGWNALRAAEKSGRLSIGREKLSDLLNAADELSAENAGRIPAGRGITFMSLRHWPPAPTVLPPVINCKRTWRMPLEVSVK